MVEYLNEIISNTCERQGIAWKNKDNTRLVCEDVKCPYIKKERTTYLTDHLSDVELLDSVELVGEYVCGIYKKEVIKNE